MAACISRIGDNDMRKQGILKSWHVNGYGIIAVDQNELYFLHLSNLIGESEDPEVGRFVEFDVAPPFGKGKFKQAVKAMMVSSEVSR